jgi:mono/diheme cytochrome c family protein
MEVKLHSFRICLLLPALLVASAASAADAGNGKRLAEARCVTCHRVGLDRPREVADAPPFEVIAQKYASDPARLAFAMLEPHPRMNVAITRREAEDIAAYIGSLAK